MKNEDKKSFVETRVKHEIELWKKELIEQNNDMNEYFFMCMNAAYELYLLFEKQGHSGMSAGITTKYFDKLVSGKPLTKLTDNDEEWELFDKRKLINGLTVQLKYQNKRYSSLFKNVTHLNKHDTIEYHDNNRIICHNPIMDTDFHLGLVNRVYDEINPIKMPYMPGESDCIIDVFDFQSDQNDIDKSDFDTVVILTAHNKNGEKTVINRFFREPKKDEIPTLGNWVEIDIFELEERIKASAMKNLALSDLGLEDMYDEMSSIKFNTEVIE